MDSNTKGIVVLIVFMAFNDSCWFTLAFFQSSQKKKKKICTVASHLPDLNITAITTKCSFLEMGLLFCLDFWLHTCMLSCSRPYTLIIRLTLVRGENSKMPKKKKKNILTFIFKLSKYLITVNSKYFSLMKMILHTYKVVFFFYFCYSILTNMGLQTVSSRTTFFRFLSSGCNFQ